MRDLLEDGSTYQEFGDWARANAPETYSTLDAGARDAYGQDWAELTNAQRKCLAHDASGLYFHDISTAIGWWMQTVKMPAWRDFFFETITAGLPVVH